MFKNDCHSYKNDPPPRLDRLSALLQGVAPRVEVCAPTDRPASLTQPSGEQALNLYLIVEGGIGFGTAPGQCLTIDAPAVIVCRTDLPHVIEADPVRGLRGLLSAKAFLDGPVGALLLAEFAAAISISLRNTDDSLQHVVSLIATELQAPRCGHAALLNRAGDILFIGLLRHLIAQPAMPGGLFNALSDPRIARTLVAIHARPQENWTLETLAAEAGMSRTAFANAFRKAMHRTPGKYLGTLRLAIAQEAVQAGHGLKHAARLSGYMSSSALSRALSRCRRPIGTDAPRRK